MSDRGRSNSSLSAVSSVPNEKIVTLEEQQEILRVQKMQHYQNLLKLEQQFNLGSIGQINSQQDSEINEILSSCDSYLSQCLNSIAKNDYLFSFSSNIENFTKTTQKKVRLTNQESNSETESSNLSKGEPSITFESVVFLDFLRNGIRSGPLPMQRDKADPERNNQDLTSTTLTATATTNLTTNTKAHKADTSQNPSLISQLNFKQSSNTKSSLTLKYLLVLDLDQECFEFGTVSSKNETLYSMRLKKRPQKWSANDYHELTVEVKSSSKEPLNRIVSNILKYREKLSTQSSCPRFLNSRAIFDRILKHFINVLKNEWLVNQSPENALKISEDLRWCELKDNQIRVGFKWRGVKQKDIDVIMFINLAVKFKDELIQERVNNLMISIINTFTQNGGFFTRLPMIQSEVFYFISNWMEKNLKLDMSSVYLIPNGVHYWSLFTQPLKLNLIRFLCWINNVTSNSIGNELICDVLTGRDKSNNVQIKAFISQVLASQKGYMNKSPSFTTLLNNNGPCGNLFLIIKSLQLFNYLSLSNNQLSAKMNNFNQSEDDLVLDLVLLEISRMRDNPKLSSNRIVPVWSPDNIFDRLWSILIQLRSSLLSCSMDDPFLLYENVLPSCFISFIGSKSFDSIMPLFSHKSMSVLNTLGSNAVDKNSSQEIDLKKIIEIAMRTLFTGVITEV